MRTTPSRFITSLTGACCLLAATSAFAGHETLQNIAVLTIQQASMSGPNASGYQLASQKENADLYGAALLSDNPARGYSIANGTTTVVVALPKIETIDTVSFFNQGAKGHVTISTSNVKLAASSPRWRKIGQQDIASDIVKAVLGPNEAKYVKITFDLNEPGQISGLGVYSPATSGTYALLAADTAADQSVESDGKTVAEGKDLGDSKEIPAEGPESPAEGPPPGLPQPPPFTFVPLLVPTSP